MSVSLAACWRGSVSGVLEPTTSWHLLDVAAVLFSIAGPHAVLLRVLPGLGLCSGLAKTPNPSTHKPFAVTPKP